MLIKVSVGTREEMAQMRSLVLHLEVERLFLALTTRFVFEYRRQLRDDRLLKFKSPRVISCESRMTDRVS